MGHYLDSAAGQELTTNDPVRTAAAKLAGSIIVYGTVLPWHTDPGPMPAPDAPVPNWSEFMRVTPKQAAEWRALRDESNTLHLLNHRIALIAQRPPLRGLLRRDTHEL